MTGSAAEREIRDAVAAYARAGIPNARIIHELIVGECRADLAAVTPDRVTLFEIKSQKDSLDRLPRQLEHFRAAAHAVILVAHLKWFDTKPYQNGMPRLADTLNLKGAHETWCYPEPSRDVSPYGLYRWSFPRPTLIQPRARWLLNLLLKRELIEEAHRHRVSVSSRDTCLTIIGSMNWAMTGRQIAEAACRQLRRRSFPEADPPILDEKGAP